MQPSEPVYVYTFYVSIQSITSSLEVDVRDEEFTEEEWASYSDEEKNAHLRQLFQQYVGDLCDQGWYTKK